MREKSVGKAKKKKVKKSVSSRSERKQSFVTFGMVCLGCPKNLVDSEKIGAYMLEEGFVLCEDEASADVVIINTCSFIAPARGESQSAIREFAALRRKGQIRALVVTGCMVQQEGAKLLEQFEEIDAAVSFSAYPRLPEIVRNFLDNGERCFEGGRDYELKAETGRLLLSGPFSAYLRISEGCSNSCTFCTIPAIRGPFRSKPPEAVLEEARELAEFGIKELVLIAQDTTAYGSDSGGGTGIVELLEKIAAVKGISWIRLMYANPEKVTDKLVDAIAELEPVVRYLDMPIQHISGSVLKRMGRRHGEKETRELVEKLHDRIPGLALRTSVMVGFPGETQEDFKKLLDFVNEGHFQRLGAFTYSNEKGTPASRLKGHIAPQEAAKRYEELMLAQQQVAFDFAGNMVGKEIEALVEIENGGEGFEGRTFMDAPEIDCAALILTPEARPGQICALKVVDTQGYDLILDCSGGKGKNG